MAATHRPRLAKPSKVPRYWPAESPFDGRTATERGCGPALLVLSPVLVLVVLYFVGAFMSAAGGVWGSPPEWSVVVLVIWLLAAGVTFFRKAWPTGSTASSHSPMAPPTKGAELRRYWFALIWTSVLFGVATRVATAIAAETVTLDDRLPFYLFSSLAVPLVVLGVQWALSELVRSNVRARVRVCLDASLLGAAIASFVLVSADSYYGLGPLVLGSVLGALVAAMGLGLLRDTAILGGAVRITAVLFGALLIGLIGLLLTRLPNGSLRVMLANGFGVLFVAGLVGVHSFRARSEGDISRDEPAIHLNGRLTFEDGLEAIYKGVMFLPDGPVVAERPAGASKGYREAEGAGVVQWAFPGTLESRQTERRMRWLHHELSMAALLAWGALPLTIWLLVRG